MMGLMHNILRNSPQITGCPTTSRTELFTGTSTIFSNPLLRLESSGVKDLERSMCSTGQQPITVSHTDEEQVQLVRALLIRVSYLQRRRLTD
ncbi:hypothetical protein CEXT_199251 [Caerostris extrusa]|uniref:Uncharacterized protein n=1 Tax=Caerostris extrusa TaxID=172846 RepID=A0AAV4WRD7_CAEEX|nr:hypothetical protein CEXT_199251 [Caerostris extrusa]